MKKRFILSTVLLALCFLSAPTTPAPSARAYPWQSTSDKKEITVWVNTKSGVYHCPGSRWYGNTKEGKYMGECEAQKAGYRPAYGSLCGSDCARYPWAMTWEQCKKLWGDNARTFSTPQGMHFRAYRDRHLNVMLDDSGKNVVSLGVY